MRIFRLLVASFLLLVLSPWTAVVAAPPVSSPPEAETDRLALAALLLKDNLPQRALAVLAEVPLLPGGDAPAVAGLPDRSPDSARSAPPRPELPSDQHARFFTLRGLAHLKTSQFSEAVSDFVAALDCANPDPLVPIFLAQARAETRDWPGVLSALAGATPEALATPGVDLMRVDALRESGDIAGAYAAVVNIVRRRPEDRAARGREVLLLVRLGLFRQALDRARDDAPDVVGGGVWVLDPLTIAEALRGARAFEAAVELLEAARLGAPDDAALLLALARAHLDAGRPLAAAELLRRACERDPKLALEAAELYRRAGQALRALEMNARVPDGAAKTRQRLGLLIDLGRFDQAAALIPRLERLGLTQEEPLAYAVGYVFFRLGRLDEAEARLDTLTDPTLFERGMELRRAIDLCRREPTECP